MTDQIVATTNGKAERFRKVAERRVSNALDQIRRIGNLSNSVLYAYEPHQVTKVFETMRDELDAAEARFARGSTGSPPAFTLD